MSDSRQESGDDRPFKGSSKTNRSPPERTEYAAAKRGRGSELGDVDSEMSGAEDRSAVRDNRRLRERIGKGEPRDQLDAERANKSIVEIRNQIKREVGGKISITMEGRTKVLEACDDLSTVLVRILSTNNSTVKNLYEKTLELKDMITELRLANQELDLKLKAERVERRKLENKQQRIEGDTTSAQPPTTRQMITPQMPPNTQQTRTEESRTYAAITRRGEQEKQTQQEHIMIVKSKTEGTTAADLKKKLVDRLPIGEIGPLKRIRETRKGEILLETTDERQKGMIGEHIVRMDSVEAREPDRRRPRVKLTGVEVGQKGDSIATNIFNQNQKIQGLMEQENFVEGIKCVHVRKCRNIYKENWHLDVSREVYDTLMVKCEGKIYLDLVTIFVEDWVEVTRCYRCCGFGHTSARCTEKEACERCGDEHRERDCRALTLNCPACQRMGMAPRGHSARDPLCPVLQRRMEIQKSRRGT